MRGIIFSLSIFPTEIPSLVRRSTLLSVENSKLLIVNALEKRFGYTAIFDEDLFETAVIIGSLGVYRYRKTGNSLLVYVSSFLEVK